MNLVMMITIGAFFCQMSDPTLGGTYMTMFNTFFFMGWLIPNTIVLKMVDEFTYGECSTNTQNSCSTKDFRSVSNTFFHFISVRQKLFDGFFKGTRSTSTMDRYKYLYILFTLVFIFYKNVVF